MAKSNKTEYALLGILSIEPMSGYDIRNYVQQSIGFFWQESYGQIYPALRQLTARRLVSKRRAKTSRGPARYVYSITPAGRNEFADWLTAEPEPEKVRNELLLKLYFGTMGNRADHVHHLERLLASQSDRLKQFAQIEKHVLPEYEGVPDYPYWRSTLRFGQHVTRARVRWCQETLEWLKNGSNKK